MTNNCLGALPSCAGESLRVTVGEGAEADVLSGGLGGLDCRMSFMKAVGESRGSARGMPAGFLVIFIPKYLLVDAVLELVWIAGLCGTPDLLFDEDAFVVLCLPRKLSHVRK